MGLGRPWNWQGGGGALLVGPLRAVAVVVAVAGVPALSGCASQSIVDNLPASMGGLPESVPKRSEEPVVYPAVHDLPPARSASPLTEQEKKRLREELAAERERVAKKGGVSTSGATRDP